MGDPRPLFDDEARKWDGLYRDSPGARWGLLQGYAQRRVRGRMALCLSLLPDVAGLDVIEIGCGPGHYGGRLIGEGARWTGVDLSSRMLSICRATTGSGRLVRADAVRLPLRAASCDIMLCIGLLSYLSRAEIADLLEDARSIIRPGGLLLAQTVRFDPITWVRCRLPRAVPRPVRIPGPFHPRNPRTIARLIAASGLRLERTVPYRKFLVYPAGTIYLARRE
ncbi:MAG: methyltransferase domain-containing protein [bacterium]|nr:methyltransferase domain-containing protein [bacterium]